ncbi:MAG: flagellar protein FlbB [Treponema sp.]|nr:flagellar protein FlbB [Treponema sp.]
MWGRIIVLLILILVLAGGGIVWFDYLNVIDAKAVLAPLYRFIGREPQTGLPVGPDDFINLDAERLAVIIETYALKDLDLDRREAEILVKLAELEQLSEQLDQDRKALEEMQNSINQYLENAEILDRNVEGISRQLTNMPPERAVAIIAEMTDQVAISVLRKTEEIARRDGTTNIVPYWMSLLEPQRAAEIQRKMMLDSP